MDIAGRVCVVTGAGSGIGRALCARFAAAGAAGIVAADIDGAAAEATTQSHGGIAHACDVSCSDAVAQLVETATARYGRVDVFVSNAGILERRGLDASPRDWQRVLDVNLMAHVHAATAVLPQMLARGEGYLVSTASAAGLLMQIDSATYTVSKHGALAFAEWLAVNYRDRGIRVSCLCPQGVRTPMLLGPRGDRKSFLLDGALDAGQVAEAVITAMREERFLILPHPEVAGFERGKAADRERWLAGMRRLKARIDDDPALAGRDE